MRISSNEERDSVSIEDVCNFVKTYNLRLTKPMVIYAFSYSKSTIMQDHDQFTRQNYNKLQFGEFVELLCRLTLAVFNQSEMAGLQLSEKLTYMMNDIFGQLGEQTKLP